MEQKLTQTAIKNAVSQQFFNQLSGSQRSQQQPQNLNKSQMKASQQVKEVEDVFNLESEEDELDINDASFSKNILSKISNRTSRHLKPTQYVHGAIAMTLNVFTVLSSSPFNLFQRNFFLVYFFVSILVTFRYIMNYKSYAVFEYEDLYGYLKKKSSHQLQKLQVEKLQQPFSYYNKVINFLSESFPGVLFEYKMQKKIKDSEEYLKKQREQSQIGKKLRKLIKSLVRIIFNWHHFDQTADDFVRANDNIYLKYIKAKYWQNDEVLWTYFIFMNLPIVVSCYFGGFHIVFVDLLLIYCLSKVYELNRAQLNGDKLLNQTLQYIEKKSQFNAEQQRIKNGKIVQDYIKLKHKQYVRQSQDVSRISHNAPAERRQSVKSNERPINLRQKGSVPSQDRENARNMR
ncbi:UNKNOWN [Stylonychia lemnae]|uniref:Transmembrane protein n=1 Tax=Stylonychia lemnae TaxID=5949 RepID=A0A078B0W3_STYLE|nr:UNKNOWN [Stylonychia lemnae]|eukprot:CDW87951.1 UNKNOWN [Stylonychia lemnae]